MKKRKVKNGKSICYQSHNSKTCEFKSRVKYTEEEAKRYCDAMNREQDDKHYWYE